MHFFSADCIITNTGEPCFDSVLAVNEEGTIEGVYAKSELIDQPFEIHNYEGILCPGFVNTHCHLELSWAKGLISKGEGLDLFVRQLEKFKGTITEKSIYQAIEDTTSAMEMAGIIATADIANGIDTLALKSRNTHYFHTFVEVFGSDTSHARAIFEKAEFVKKQFETKSLNGKASIVPHATYSLSEELFRLVAVCAKGQIISLHHQENADENLFFNNGSGPIAERRKTFNPDLPDFTGCGKRPLESIAEYFGRDQKLLLVHNTVTRQPEIDFVKQYFSRAYWCFCPNANLYIENRLPDINLFRKNKCKLTLGTDSLASNHQISILEEIKTIQHYFPEIPLIELLSWGTINGAEFLGIEQISGSFEKGKSPGVVLIENVDVHAMKLNPESTSRLILKSGRSNK